MLVIYTENHRKPISHSFTLGQIFPTIQGKLLKVELSGKELLKYSEAIELPICYSPIMTLVWHPPHVGRLVKSLREIFKG
jgi:hypothetical protein